MNSQHLKNLRIVYCVGGCGATEYILHSAPILHIAEVEIWMSRIIPPWQTEAEHCINTTETLCYAYFSFRYYFRYTKSQFESEQQFRLCKLCVQCPVWRVFMAEAGPWPWPGAVDVLMSTFLVTRSRGQGPGGGWGPCSAAGEETETHLARNWVRSAWSEPGPSQHQLLTPSTGGSGPFGPCGL